MRRLHYHKVDVFTDRAFGGNPLSVFINGRGISSEMMQTLAKELNLSEATFVLPPQNPANNYKLRIFTPGKELPIAGHPTVGTTFVLAREHMFDWTGDHATIVLEEGVGDIPVSVEFENNEPGMIWMTQPKPQFGRKAEGAEIDSIADMLSLPMEALDERYPVQIVSSGVPFLYVPLKNLEAIRNVRIKLDVNERIMKEFGTTELFIFTREVEGADSTVHSRMFAPMLGVWEDPATGGATGPLGAYLVRYGIADDSQKMISEQGIEMGRPSYLHIQIDQQGGEITSARVGGRCFYMGEGFFEIE